MSIPMNVVLWVVALILLVVLELATVQLVSIWFVIGTIPAIFVAAFGGAVGTQLLVFVAVSLAVLVFARPYLLRRFGTEATATNADRVLGTDGYVLEEINNTMGTGRVHANGLDWTARAETPDDIIPEAAIVTVLEIQGVKLIVSPQQEQGEE